MFKSSCLIQSPLNLSLEIIHVERNSLRKSRDHDSYDLRTIFGELSEALCAESCLSSVPDRVEYTVTWKASTPTDFTFSDNGVA